MTSLESLSRRWRLCGQVSTVTPLAIAAGRSAAALDGDDPVLKDFSGRPVVPGSSLRGALRAALEGLLRSLGTPNLACDPLEAPCPRPPADFEPDLGPGGRERERRWTRVIGGWTPSQIEAASCSVCRLFGSRHLRSRLVVRDMSVDGPWSDHLLAHRETVALDRDSETAVEAHRRSYEAVAGGVTFGLELTIDDPREGGDGAADDLGLLTLALDQLDAGWTTLGGRRGAGLGMVRVRLSVLEMTNARMLLAGSPAERITGAALDELISRHRERASRSLTTEAVDVPNPA